MYNISITSRAEKDINRLDRPIKNRIITAITALADDPRPPGCTKVHSEEGVWRIRIGDWRVGYIIDDDTKDLTIIRVGHRSEFYD